MERNGLEEVDLDRRHCGVMILRLLFDEAKSNVTSGFNHLKDDLNEAAGELRRQPKDDLMTFVSSAQVDMISSGTRHNSTTIRIELELHQPTDTDPLRNQRGAIQRC